jgi:hypothetical protein
VCERETIDTDLRLLAAVRRSFRGHGGDDPSSRQIDELLDERDKNEN